MNKIAEIVEIAPIRVYEVCNTKVACVIAFVCWSPHISSRRLYPASKYHARAQTYHPCPHVLPSTSCGTRQTPKQTCSFYSMFNREPVGKFLLQVCGTTPCQLCGAEKVIEAIEHHLHIHKGQTSADGFFTLMEVECLGACVNAPMMQCNDDFYEDLTPANTVKLLDDLKAGRPVKIGPQNHRRVCEGPMGQTSLTGEVPGPTSRDFDALKKEIAAKAAAPPAAPAPK